jgi:hypothetical protein
MTIFDETLKIENNLISWITGTGRKIEVSKDDFQEGIKIILNKGQLETFAQARDLFMHFITCGKTIKDIRTKSWMSLFRYDY